MADQGFNHFDHFSHRFPSHASLVPAYPQVVDDLDVDLISGTQLEEHGSNGYTQPGAGTSDGGNGRLATQSGGLTHGLSLDDNGSGLRLDSRTLPQYPATNTQFSVPATDSSASDHVSHQQQFPLQNYPQYFALAGPWVPLAVVQQCMLRFSVDPDFYDALVLQCYGIGAGNVDTGIGFRTNRYPQQQQDFSTIDPQIINRQPDLDLDMAATGQEGRMYDCGYCMATFGSVEAVSTHHAQVHPFPPQPIFPAISAIPTPTGATGHSSVAATAASTSQPSRRSHTSERSHNRHRTPYTPYPAHTPRALTDVTNTANPPNTARQFWCTIPTCRRAEGMGGKAFSRRDNRNTHVRGVHGMAVEVGVSPVGMA